MKRLKGIRNEMGLTQKELAEILGVNQATVSYWEKGVSSPDFNTLKILANYFDVSVSYLLGEDNSASLSPKKLEYASYYPALDKIIESGITPQNLLSMVDLILWAKENGVEKLKVGL